MIKGEAMREKIKSLWKLCFNDSDEFTDMYFRLRYSNEVNITIQSGEEVIAALQILPYPMTFGKSEIKTGYVSGACTHPDYRNRGAMRELLSQAFTRMLHNDMSISTLIPAEHWLFGYYAGMGYVPVFKYSSTTFTASEVTIADKAVVLNKINDYQEESSITLMRMFIPKGHNWENKLISEVHMPTGAIALMIKRGRETIITRGNTKICGGDNLILSIPAYEKGDNDSLEEINITSDNNWCNRTIRQLNLPENLIIALVKRGEENIIPIGDTLIQNGDVVVIYRG